MLASTATRRTTFSRRTMFGPFRCSMSATCRARRTVPGRHQRQRRDLRDVGPERLRLTHLDAVVALALPELGHDFAAQRDADSFRDFARGQADARRRLAVDAHLELRDAARFLDAQIGDAFDAVGDRANLLRESARAPSRSGPNTRMLSSAGVPPSPSSMRMPSGVVKSAATPGTSSSASRIPSATSRCRRVRCGLQLNEHVADHVRHRIFGLFRSARTARDERDAGDDADHVLDLNVHLVDVFERRLAGQHRLDQQRAFVEFRHELGADVEQADEGGDGEGNRQDAHGPRVAEGPRERRARRRA